MNTPTKSAPPDAYFQTLSDILADNTKAKEVLETYVPTSTKRYIPWFLKSLECLMGNPSFDAKELCMEFLIALENVEGAEEYATEEEIFAHNFAVDVADIVTSATAKASSDPEYWQANIRLAQETGDNYLLTVLYMARMKMKVEFTTSQGF